jgi:hypothetical protein
MTPEEFGLSLIGTLQVPELEELKALILNHEAHDGVPDLAGAFDRLIVSYVPKRINMMLDHMATSLETEVPFGFSRFLLLNVTEHYSLGLSVVDHDARHLYWHPSHTWYRRLDDGLSMVHRYGLPNHVDNNVVDRSVSLTLTGMEPFDRGTMLVRDGSRDVLDFQLRPGEPIVMIRLQLPLMGGLEWMFGRKSLKPIGATSLRPDHSHLLSLITAASMLGDGNSVEAIRGALGHANHAVRWAAAQALGRLDRAAAAAALETLATDSHPHIRAAAQRTLLRASASCDAPAESPHGIHARA